MRKIAATILLAFAAVFCSAQSYEGTINYLKKDEKSIVMELPYPPSTVEEAIVKKLESMGYKSRESKGFLVYKNIVLPDISSEPADYMIRVEKKSRKDKDESVVYFMISRRDENIIARGDALVNSNAKVFVNNFTPDVESHNLELQIKAQEDIVTKAEKKMKDLQDDQESMEKKVKKLQDDLKDNAKDQQDQQKEIERQKQVLEAMKGKVRG